MEGGPAPLGSAGQGGFSCAFPGSPLLSSTSPLFMPLPLGCQIWLTQSVVSLLRLAPGPKPSALHHCSSPCTRRGEGGPEGPGQAATPQLAFLTSCSRSCLGPRCWGLLGAARWSLEAGQGLSFRETPGSRPEVRHAAVPLSRGAREAGASVQDPVSHCLGVTLGSPRPHPMQRLHLYREQLATQNPGDCPERRRP